MNKKNSLTHPLQISNVELMSGAILGLTFCPGKKQPNSISGHWDRDLELDLDLIRLWGAAAVVTLMPQQELDAVNVGHIGEEVERQGMEWYHLPIVDVDVPGENFERHWLYAGLRLRMHLRAGRRILIHCRGGLGRTGTIAGRLMVELGNLPAESVARVRTERPGAIETDEQERHVHNVSYIEPERDAFMDRLLGCLLGGAVGDAFGYAVEFDSLEKIQSRFGEKGLTKPVFVDGKLVVSDDTQMTLFTLEGLIRAARPDGTCDLSTVLEQVRLSYLDWLDTQSEKATSKKVVGQLAARPAMRARRAPGNTCLAALKAGAKGTINKPLNDSKGCGAAMRTAPVGFLTVTDVFDVGARIGAMTHGHPDGWAPAGVVALAVQRLVEDFPIKMGVYGSFSSFTELGYEYGVVANGELFVLAMKLAQKMRFDPKRAIRMLGEGWVGDEAVAIAIYAFLSGKGFCDVLGRAVNHDGDSDSTGSIAGQLWGAKYGCADIPNDWVRRLDVFDEVLSVAKGAASWRSTAGTIRGMEMKKVVPPDSCAPYVRLIEMIHELHIQGYQQLRFCCLLDVNSKALTMEISPARNLPHSWILNEGSRIVATWKTGDGWSPFGWRGTQEMSVQDLANQFRRQFPELIELARGDDWSYVGWMTALLGRIRQGYVPYFHSDYMYDNHHSIGMIGGEVFPMPPVPPEPAERENPLAGSVGSDAQFLDETGPLPTSFDFTDSSQRVLALISFFHYWEPQLLPMVQHVWDLLAPPASERCAVMAQRVGRTGKGKTALRRVLEQYLADAASACETVPEPAALHETYDPSKPLNFHGEYFEAMDFAIEKVAIRYALVFGDEYPEPPKPTAKIISGPWKE